MNHEVDKLLRAVDGMKCQNLDRILTDPHNLEARMQLYLSKSLIFVSSVMPKHFIEAFITTVLLLKVTTLLGVKVKFLGKIIKADDFCGLAVLLFALVH